MIKANTGPSLVYSPLPETILRGMRCKIEELNETYALSEREMFIFEYAWREALLYALSEMDDTKVMLDYEQQKHTQPTYALFKEYLGRLAKEIELDNALSPFVNYED